MRIMIVTDQFFPMLGGVPAVTRSLAECMAGRGHAVTIVAPAHGGSEQGRLSTSLTVYRCPSISWPAYDGQRIALLPIGRLRRLVAAQDPDVVHVHSLLTLGAAARRVSIRAGKSLIATHHYLPLNTYPALIAHPSLHARLEGVAYPYMLRFYNRCRVVTAPTATALRPLIERGLRPPSVALSNGVDLTRFSPDRQGGETRRRFGLPTEPLLVLYVNRLSPEKQPGLLLEAAARMRAPAHVAIAGSGPLEARLRARVRQLGIADRVTFLGFVPDDALADLYRSADLFVNPSEAELQSLVTMEAMACGLPIVAANAQALPELVYHEENGFLFTPGDRDALAAYLDVLAENSALRAEMGARSRQIVRVHDRRAVLARWEALYHATMHGCIDTYR